MKEQFLDKTFSPRALEMVNVANRIIESYAAQGYGMTVRQLHYRFVAENIYKNTDQNYKSLASLVSEARMAGIVDWDNIKDLTRTTKQLDTHEGITQYLQTLNEHYRLQKWKNQKHYVEVMVEKQALENILHPLCEKWEVAFTANRGYSSSSSLYERGKYLQSMRDVEGKRVHVLYFGDLDPSGYAMSGDVKARLELFSDGPVDVQRMALNIEQVRQYDLVENPVKVDDSRAAAYIELFGTSSWELDALTPPVLVDLVEGGIKRYINMPQWEADVRKEQDEKDKLQDIIEALKAATPGAS